MSDADRRMSSYLLGELSEPEATAVEREIFADPIAFDRLVATETELVDAYVRGRLSGHLRKQFEDHYLADPRRRERVAFADALAQKVDAASATKPFPLWSGALAVGAVAAIVVLAVVNGWLLAESARARRDAAESRIAKASIEQRELALQRALADQQTRAAELTRELERLRATEPRPPANTPSSPGASVVSLLLMVRGDRAPDAGPPRTLALTPATRQVRIQLALDAAEYPRYRVELKAIAGTEVVARESVRPQMTTAGARLVLIVPAERLAAGDYVLTLSGQTKDGDVEEVSKSLFRVTKE